MNSLSPDQIRSMTEAELQDRLRGLRLLIEDRRMRKESAYREEIDYCYLLREEQWRKDLFDAEEKSST